MTATAQGHNVFPSVIAWVAIAMMSVCCFRSTRFTIGKNRDKTPSPLTLRSCRRFIPQPIWVADTNLQARLAPTTTYGCAGEVNRLQVWDNEKRVAALCAGFRNPRFSPLL